MIGKADLYALGIVGFLFPIPAMIAALIALELWRRWQFAAVIADSSSRFLDFFFVSQCIVSIFHMGIQYLYVLSGRATHSYSTVRVIVATYPAS